MNHYIPLRTTDGTVIVRSSEDACISVCCVFSTTGDLEIARFDNAKVATSMCEIWSDVHFQQCRPFFGNTFCMFLGQNDMQNREVYEFLHADTAYAIEEIRSYAMSQFGTLFVTRPDRLHESLVQEIASMN